MSMNEHLPPEGAGLHKFLEALALLLAPVASPMTVGLASYLTAAGPLLRIKPMHEQLPLVAHVPDCTVVASMLDALKEAMIPAVGRGDFLDVWQVAGLKRNELRNAAILAWLLNPRGSHGRRDAILRAVLNRAAVVAPGWWPPISDDLLLAQVQTEERPLGSDRDRVDIAVDGPNFVLFIEVKINAPEGADQLVRYAQSAWEKTRAMGKRHALVIYLAPRTPTVPRPNVACLTWRDVAAAASANLPGGLAGTIIRQFAQHVCSFAQEIAIWPHLNSTASLSITSRTSMLLSSV
jgi:hypothetical protein